MVASWAAWDIRQLTRRTWTDSRHEGFFFAMLTVTFPSVVLPEPACGAENMLTSMERGTITPVYLQMN